MFLGPFTLYGIIVLVLFLIIHARYQAKYKCGIEIPFWVDAGRLLMAVTESGRTLGFSFRFLPGCVTPFSIGLIVGPLDLLPRAPKVPFDVVRIHCIK